MAQTSKRRARDRRIHDTDEPPWRVLRAFAYDPVLATQLENYDVSEVLVRVRWEPETKDGANGKTEPCFRPGPIGEYLEVVDVDPASGCAYEPVDLNDPYLLAQNGLPPSEGNPQFHQQMVYAVAMSTIQHFERALGREIFWSELEITSKSEKKKKYKPIRRLRIYPHALREANAYYDPDKKALLFGYFPARPESAGTEMPGGMVFTCLSHDIVAHETTHAILDGMQRYFLEPSNVDALAFHEAFADLVALFQHFTYPEILRRQLQCARGDLAGESLLGQLATEFGQAIGGRGALRSAIGEYDENHKWQRREPAPDMMLTEKEPHDRGALLVAAVFDAFLAIYRHRTSDLLRIATEGTGVLPAGDLHPDLVNRLANEAAKSAEHVLLMCIRAIDYCPPVDINFGDYLRALITADYDLVPDDDRNYRVAFIEAFRKWGIYPCHVRTLSVESLCWGPADPIAVKPFLFRLRRILNEEKRGNKNGNAWEELRTGVLSNSGALTKRRLTRDEMWWRTQWLAARLHENIKQKATRLYGQRLFSGGFLGLNISLGHDEDCKFSVVTIRPVRRSNPDGRARDDLLIQLVQRRPAFLDDKMQAEETKRYERKGSQSPPPPFARADFKFRGGTTFIVDLETFAVRYAIEKDILDRQRLDRQRKFVSEIIGTSLRSLYFGEATRAERLAQLHSG
jgi:hypothetical protein